MAMMNIETIKEFQYKGYKCLIKKISYTDEGLSVIEQTNAWLDMMVDSLNEITECIQDVVLISMEPKRYFQSIIL